MLDERDLRQAQEMAREVFSLLDRVAELLDMDDAPYAAMRAREIVCDALGTCEGLTDALGAPVGKPMPVAVSGPDPRD